MKKREANTVNSSASNITLDQDLTEVMKSGEWVRMSDLINKMVIKKKKSLDSLMKFSSSPSFTKEPIDKTIEKAVKEIRKYRSDK